MPGTARKPNAQRIREGIRGHRPLRDEVNHAAGIPERPKGMSTAAIREWDYLIANMDPLMLRRVDTKSLAVLCEDEVLLWQMYRKLRKIGPMEILLTTSEGKAALNAIKDLAHRLIVERREFGLTPASRTRVEGGKPAAEGKLDAAFFSQPAESLALIQKLN